MDFINNVLKELQKQNKTQIELCEEIGISVFTFRGWVSKKVQPPVDIAYKIAVALNKSLDQLVAGTAEHPVERKMQMIKNELSEIISKM